MEQTTGRTLNAAPMKGWVYIHLRSFAQSLWSRDVIVSPPSNAASSQSQNDLHKETS